VWYGKSYYRQLIGNHTLAFDWCHFWWLWNTFEGHFSLGCHFHIHFSNPWHAFASHGLPAIAELLVLINVLNISLTVVTCRSMQVMYSLNKNSGCQLDQTVDAHSPPPILLSTARSAHSTILRDPRRNTMHRNWQQTLQWHFAMTVRLMMLLGQNFKKENEFSVIILRQSWTPAKPPDKTSEQYKKCFRLWPI